MQKLVSSSNPDMGHRTRGTVVILKALFAAEWCNQVAGWLVGYLWGAGEVDRGALGANSTSQQPATGVPRYRAKICVCTLPGLPRGVFWPDHRLTFVDLCLKIPEASSGTPTATFQYRHTQSNNIPNKLVRRYELIGAYSQPGRKLE